MTIRLAQEVGMDVVADYAERFGVYDDMGKFLANSLGSEETTLFNMVAAYAMFANGGERVRPEPRGPGAGSLRAHHLCQDQRQCVDCDDPRSCADRGARASCRIASG